MRTRAYLGVDSSFFPRARRAQQQKDPGRKREVWEVVQETTPPERPEMEHLDRMRPNFEPRPAPAPDYSQWFDVPGMWNFVDHNRRAPGYAGRPFPVDILTAPAKDPEESIVEIARFFGIPMAAFEGMTIEQAWADVIGPMFNEFEMIMNRGKPPFFPGSLRFDLSPQQELRVVYYE